MLMSAEQVKAVNKTSRARGAVGANAVVPRLVRAIANRGEIRDLILDYGAGKEALHTKALRAEGYTVFAHEIGENFVPGVHLAGALERSFKYDLVFASNVLNVLPSKSIVEAVLDEMQRVLSPAGIVIVNYPKTPRKSDLKESELIKMLKSRFAKVQKEGLAFICTPWVGNHRVGGNL